MIKKLRINSLRFQTLFWTTIIISVSFVLVMVLGLMNMNRMYLNQKVQEIQPIAERLAASIDMEDENTWILEGVGSIIKLYDVSGKEISLKDDIASMERTRPEGELPENLVVVPTDEEILSAASAYFESVFQGNRVQVIGRINHLGGRSIIIAEPIFHSGQVVAALFIMEPSVAYDSFLDGFVDFYVVMMAIFALIILIFLSFLITRVAGNLRKLSRHANAISQGDYLSVVEEDGYDEVVGLAHSLNILAGNLNEEKKKSARLEQYRQEYFSNVSHELRSPLMVIRSRAEVLKDEMIKDPEEISRYHQVILSESLRMQRLIEDMLVLSKLKSDASLVRCDSVDMNQLFRIIYEKYWVIADDMDIKIIVDDCDEDWILETDAAMLEQVIGTLIDNSLKFTPSGGEIHLGQVNNSIVVRDTGEGIPKEEQAYVFDRYYKVDKARASVGTGLGLAIAYQMMEKMGGRIWLESEPGQGTSFYLAF